MNAIPIKPRKVTFDVSTVPRHWNGGDPVLTRFFDALSVHFPEGERFFIQSVRNFQDRVKEPGLREDIRHFIRQEGQHGIVHDRFNEVMVGQGVDVDKITSNLRRFIRSSQKYLPEKYQLAMTAAFEHFTATLGEAMLKDEADMFTEADPVMRAMFLWHGVEEVEHKAVAYDVYQTAAGGGYLSRVSALVVTMLMIHLVVGPVFVNMLRLDGAMRQPGVLMRGLNRLYGRRGILTRMLPEFMAWFRPGFHPWDTGMPEKVAAWLEEYGDHGDPMRASAAVYGSSPMSEAA
ncbi:metal-dependent hydrolase [Ketobacter alkanivorans]|jgi:predicted metal-dependent hydrolase|uniref:Metal-dependent hydrolase n=1 Tax=Ketobacter alkanivorans TaxID=1917421 RepID=A0A2K9LFU5_9GAMM|nr:metal-dependent hydrolase [Ketobacter alkanivorans]AUM11041.1 metal-dependent hydrolase [Ketobacter alkanivorans]RLP52444.1 MAG: metal-dependent hydrolase [Ketobacter sp.]